MNTPHPSTYLQNPDFNTIENLCGPVGTTSKTPKSASPIILGGLRDQILSKRFQMDATYQQNLVDSFLTESWWLVQRLSYKVST
ncbi:hypothetical protein CEXT_41041 [Caerostris extrusa]|uniref:Uncharacterized protein n=1 Tax=Caerostris extrusa TaxID=172846 RepID=A0AAV4Q9S5_CAEEX|nr:hypothetical protein CEXT_41041 [Caerostris extrusa]